MKKNINIYYLIGSNGSGKNKTFEILKDILPNSKFMVSYTTRDIRDGELDNVDYYFINKEKFYEIKPGLIEHIDFGTHAYGYHQDEIINNIDKYDNLIFIIEPNGTQQVVEWFDYKFDNRYNYNVRHKLINIQTKKSVRLKRMLDKISNDKDHDEDTKEVNDIITRLQRNNDNIDFEYYMYKERLACILGDNKDWFTINNNSDLENLQEQIIEVINYIP